MDLRIRLNLLLQGGVINQQVYAYCEQVLELFAQQFNLPLTEDNGQQYMTHLARALMRVEQQESIEQVDADLYQEIVDSDHYAQAATMCESIEKTLAINIPKVECDYLIMNHCYLLMNQAEC